MVISDTPEWIDYVKNQIEPLIELEKGKLCQDDK